MASVQSDQHSGPRPTYIKTRTDVRQPLSPSLPLMDGSPLTADMPCLPPLFLPRSSAAFQARVFRRSASIDLASAVAYFTMKNLLSFLFALLAISSVQALTNYTPVMGARANVGVVVLNVVVVHTFR